MRKRFLKKSEVLHEGYMKGLKKAQRIINEMLVQSQGFDDNDEPNSYSYNGKKDDRFADGKNLNEILLDAILHGNMMKVQKALQAGADVNTKGKYGWTPLHEAAMDGKTGICKLLLDYGADVNVKADDGWTPLHFAISNRKTETCKFLLDNGADVNAKDVGDDTPLHFAVDDGIMPILELLLDYGADVNTRDNYGKTPLDFAVQEKKWAVVNFLENNM